MMLSFCLFPVSKICILVFEFNPFLSLTGKKIVTGFQKIFSVHLCVVLAFVKGVCVGEGWEVVTMDK